MHPYISLAGLQSSTATIPPDITRAMKHFGIGRVMNAKLDNLNDWNGPVMLDDEGEQFQRIHRGEGTRKDWAYLGGELCRGDRIDKKVGLYGLPNHCNPYAEGMFDGFVFAYADWSMPDCALQDDIEADMNSAVAICKRQVAKHGPNRVMPTLKLWTVGQKNALHPLDQDTANRFAKRLYVEAGVRHIHGWEIHKEDYIRLSMDPPESHAEAKWANDFFGDTYRLDPSRILPDAIRFAVAGCEMLRVACDYAAGKRVAR
jgi:hypothetical protein